jgi:hypothetical protein
MEKIRKTRWNHFLFGCVPPGISMLLPHTHSAANYALPVRPSSRVAGAYANLVPQTDSTINYITSVSGSIRHETFVAPRLMD